MNLTPKKHWKFDHVAHAVVDLEQAAEAYFRLGFSEEHREKVVSEKIEVIFLQQGGTAIELISPIKDSTEESAVQRFLEKRGPGLHHLAFMVDSVAEELTTLKSEGVKLIDEKPRNGSRGKKIGFIHPKQTFGVLIELCSSVKHSDNH